MVDHLQLPMMHTVCSFSFPSSLGSSHDKLVPMGKKFHTERVLSTGELQDEILNKNKQKNQSITW